MSVRESFSRFADELSAHRYLEKILWPDGMRCPRCGSEGRIGKLNGESTRVGAYKCYACRKSFSVTYGTLFSSSHVPVHKWLQAIYLTDGGTKPIRPHHLQHILNVSFKTASSIIRRLSAAAAESEVHGSTEGSRQVAPPAPAAAEQHAPCAESTRRRTVSRRTESAIDTRDSRHADDDAAAMGW